MTEDRLNELSLLCSPMTRELVVEVRQLQASNREWQKLGEAVRVAAVGEHHSMGSRHEELQAIVKQRDDARKMLLQCGKTRMEYQEERDVARAHALEIEDHDRKTTELLGQVHGDHCEAIARISDLKASLETATTIGEFWKGQCMRAMCGCLSLDCRVHGAFDPEDNEIVRMEYKISSGSRK
jgi:hypothetical protein